MLSTSPTEIEPCINNRCPPAAPPADRESLSEVVDEALRAHRFCLQERRLIVQIVCDAIMNRSEPKPPEKASH